MTSDPILQTIGKFESDGWFQRWEQDKELQTILNEFDHELFRGWLSKELKCQITWVKDLLTVSMHKFRTAFATTQPDLREASRAWLIQNGWSPEEGWSENENLHDRPSG